MGLREQRKWGKWVGVTAKRGESEWENVSCRNYTFMWTLQESASEIKNARGQGVKGKDQHQASSGKRLSNVTRTAIHRFHFHVLSCDRLESFMFVLPFEEFSIERRFRSVTLNLRYVTRQTSVDSSNNFGTKLSIENFPHENLIFLRNL